MKVCSKLHLSSVSGRGWRIWVGCVAGTLLVAWVVAQVVPFFTELVELSSTLLNLPCCWLIPIAMYTFHQYSTAGGATAGDGEQAGAVGTEREGAVAAGGGGYAYRPSVWEWGLTAVEFGLALSVTVTGCWFAIENLVARWAEVGYPFDCHCENMWATCACSGAHTGMVEQCPPPPPGLLPTTL